MKSGRILSPVEQAWVGALIEGEGWITHGVSKGRPFLKLGLANTNLELISALLRATGVGRVHLMNHKRFGRKPLWIWQVQVKEQVEHIAEQCVLYSTKCQDYLNATTKS